MGPPKRIASLYPHTSLFGQVDDLGIGKSCTYSHTVRTIDGRYARIVDSDPPGPVLMEKKKEMRKAPKKKKNVSLSNCVMRFT